MRKIQIWIIVMIIVIIGSFISNQMDKNKVEKIIGKYQDVPTPGEVLEFDMDKLLTCLNNKEFDKLKDLVDLNKVDYEKMKFELNFKDEMMLIEDGYNIIGDTKVLDIKYISTKDFFGGKKGNTKNIIEFVIDSKTNKIIEYGLLVKQNYSSIDK